MNTMLSYNSGEMQNRAENMAQIIQSYDSDIRTLEEEFDKIKNSYSSSAAEEVLNALRKASELADTFKEGVSESRRYLVDVVIPQYIEIENKQRSAAQN